MRSSSLGASFVKTFNFWVPILASDYRNPDKVQYHSWFMADFEFRRRLLKPVVLAFMFRAKSLASSWLDESFWCQNDRYSNISTNTQAWSGSASHAIWQQSRRQCWSFFTLSLRSEWPCSLDCKEISDMFLMAAILATTITTLTTLM
jgi:hypothetical protein